MSFISVYQCDICLKNNSAGLTALVNHEKVLALKLIRSRKNYILLLREPTYACVPCFRKLHVLNILIQGVILRKLNGKMQQPCFPVSPKNGEEDDSQAPPEAEETCLHDYTCQCSNCRSKYGGLPLLLQVIEQKSQEKTEKSAEPEPQPSTSSSQDSDHPPKKLLICQYCSKNFTHKGDYNKHLRKHTREQPFTCPVCKRKFAHTSNLQRHYRLHSGHRPFVCKNCDKRFSRKDKLECHMKSKYCKSASVPTNK